MQKITHLSRNPCLENIMDKVSDIRMYSEDNWEQKFQSIVQEFLAEVNNGK